MKICTSHSNSYKDTFEGGNFLGGGQIQGGKIFWPMKMLVFAMIIVFLTDRIGGKIPHVELKLTK